ncbi:MAG: TonB-dependent receptor [Bacteroidales bacterium]|nr:TonB-dependent receptor [Bacteroidales bacterium]
MGFRLQIILIIFQLIIIKITLSQEIIKDTIKAEEVEIISGRIPYIYNESSRVVKNIIQKEIEQMPVKSVEDILRTISAIDVRSRGIAGVQSDISIRGGSFEQQTILLDGMRINDPQTGHYTLNLPVSSEDIESIEILEGAGARLYGSNAFNGAINIITGSGQPKSLKAFISGGEYGLFSTGISGSYTAKGFKNFAALSKSTCNGYKKNTDFDILNMYYKGSYNINTLSIGLIAGYNDKQYGANSFYTPKYPEQFEHTKTVFFDLQIKQGNRFKKLLQVYKRRNNDKFELFRDTAPIWYKNHNYHQTDVNGINAGFIYNSSLGKTALGLDIREEKIMSNVLGKAMTETISVRNENNAYYSKKDSRIIREFYIEHNLEIKKIILSGGILFNKTSSFSSVLYPGFDFSYEFKPGQRFFATINKTLRIPTYTELYYEGPTNTGNPALLPESAINFETGIKSLHKTYIESGFSVFYSMGKNIIDWVKTNSEDKWASKNHTKLNSKGIGLWLTLKKEIFKDKLRFIENLKISYNYIDCNKNSGIYISNYALDYLKHRTVITLKHKIWKNISGSWIYSYNYRAGNYTAYPSGIETKYQPYQLLDGRISFKHKIFQLYIEASNIFDIKYNDIGNIELPGRWLKAGIIIKLPS